MTLQEIIDQLNLVLLTNPNDFFAMVPSGGYASDMLSCVMTGAPHRGIWVTLQAHGNIVAVGALAELCAIIITEGVLPDQDTISKANHEGVTLLSTGMKTYEVVGRLWELGLKNS
jgi:hypothetical protein